MFSKRDSLQMFGSKSKAPVKPPDDAAKQDDASQSRGLLRKLRKSVSGSPSSGASPSQGSSKIAQQNERGALSALATNSDRVDFGAARRGATGPSDSRSAQTKLENSTLDDVESRLSKLKIDSKSRPEPLYTKLNPQKREIRTLLLLPDQRTSALIRCKLQIVSFDESPFYVTLSYVWGDPENQVEIEVNGQRVRIRKNLAAALRQFRSMGKIPYSKIPGEEDKFCSLLTPLWVDALCINQEDAVEKSIQVQMMGEICSENATIGWLGPDPKGTISRAFSVLNTMYKECPDESGSLLDVDWMKNYPNLCKQDETSDLWNADWTAVKELFDLEYWKRVWIVQEIGFSPSLVFMAGSEFIEKFCIKLVMNFVGDIRNHLIMKPEWIPLALWEIWKDDLLNVDVSIVLGVDQLQDLPKGARYVWMRSTINHRATQPEDKIFGLQAIVGHLVPVDYNKSVQEIYCECARGWAEACGNPDTLYFLRMAGIGYGFQNSYNLPSWVPDWYALSHADLPPEVYKPWDDWAATRCLGFLIKDDDLHCRIRQNVLFEHGYRGGKVLFAIEAQTEPVEVCRWLRDKTSPDGKYLLPRYLRITTWDRDPVVNVKKPKLGDLPAGARDASLYVQLLQLMMQGKLRGSEADSFLEVLGLAKSHECTPTFYEMFPGLSREIPYVHPDVRLSLIAMIWKQGHGSYSDIPEHMRIFIMDNGYLGSGPRLIEPNDVVCFLQGSNIPVLLREEGSHFVHVGPCFIPDLMEGAMSQAAFAGLCELEIEEFEIH